MVNCGKKMFLGVLTGLLILGGIPGSVFASPINSRAQAERAAIELSNLTYAQWNLPEHKHALEQSVKEIPKKAEATYKEGEALVIYYGNDALLENSKEVHLKSDIKIDKVWDFGLSVDKKEMVSNHLDPSRSNEIIMKVSSATMSTQQLITILKTDPNVKTAEPNYICKATDLSTNDTYLDYQWGLQNTGQNAGTVNSDINVDTVWNAGIKGTEKVIAIIDTGVNYNHEDLVANMWTNENTGILGGIHGYDFVNYDDDPLDDNGHGTHCSGIIAAEANNSGITGVNQSAQIMALKFLDSYGYGETSSAIDAYNYIYQAQTKLDVNVVAINNSWSGYGDNQEFTIMTKVIDKVGQEGALSICAAGNGYSNTDGISVIMPCCVESDYVISVAASNENDELAAFSNYGKNSVDLAAPGTNILSSVLENTFNPSIYKEKDAYCDHYTDFTSASSFSDCILMDDNTNSIDTTDLLKTDTETYFGSENGGSLCLNLPNMRENDSYELLIPYTTYESAKPVYDSVMIKGTSSSGGDLYVAMFDVSLDSDGKPSDGPLIDTVSFEDNNYWDHIYGEAMKTSVANESRAVLFRVTAFTAGDYQVNIDDLAVSKANLDASSFGQYDFYNGTSMAAPHVTGSVALASSYFENREQTLSASELRDQIVSSVRKVPSMTDLVSSGGILDLSIINQPVPFFKGATINKDRKVELKGKFFGTDGNLKINSVGIATDQYKCEDNIITILDENLNSSIINTTVNLEFTTSTGTTTGSYYIIGASKTANKVGTFTDVYAYGDVISDGANLYFLDDTNCLYKYNSDTIKDEKDDSITVQDSSTDSSTSKKLSFTPLSPILTKDLFPADIIDETTSKELILATELVYSEKKIWAVVSNSTHYSNDFALVSYDTTKDIWVKEAELPMEVIGKHNYFTLAAYNGMLYCIGGLNMSDHTASTGVYMFDPEAKQWSQKVSLPEGRFKSIAKQVGDKLVVTLGGNDSGSCPKNLIFDGMNWTEQTAVLKPMSSQILYLFNKEIIYYTAEIGSVKGGLIYANLPSDGAGMIYTYDLALDKYIATDYKLLDDISLSDILATSVGDELFALYTIDTDETYSTDLVSIPIETE